MSDAGRVMDANGNRAREALRTLEDVARFVLDDAALASEAKRLRHGLREAWGDAVAYDHRDTPGDVGTAHTTPAETQRADIQAIATAAGKRLGEALRVLEEFAKLPRPEAPDRQTGDSVQPPDAAALKQLRYAAYTLEQRIGLRLAACQRGRQWSLCLLLTVSACRLPWAEVLDQALDAGVDCVQVREKSPHPPADTDAAQLTHCRAVVDRVRTFAAQHPDRPAPSVIINDRPDLALAADADGVHLGQGDLPVLAARRVVGSHRLIGVSTHGIADALAAEQAGADYCGVGPMFSSGTKAKTPEQVAAAGPGYLRTYVEACRLPHLAIGGITAERFSVLLEAGVRGIAVCGAICGSENPAGAVHSFRRTPKESEPAV
ncbi:MAG: thiamine phosphate synthase [Planctomycetota bacterium]